MKQSFSAQARFKNGVIHEVSIILPLSRLLGREAVGV